MYFFNAALFNDGNSLMRLGQFYQESITQSNIEFNMLFGPAYKGIPLATTISIAFAYQQKNVPVAFNRKEIKDHGEGGIIMGSPLQGKVLIVDDVISAGTSIKESIRLIEQTGASVAGVVVALDRQEKGGSGDDCTNESAVQYIQNTFNIPVIAIASLSDLFSLSNEQITPFIPSIKAYRNRYGVMV
jgi:orotate phosphoribosyltransferase